ncbi:hypothetical protein [Rheinheimera tilapiae]|uniref:DUF3592 domain-containing protein n=1 Tax=Rheinheimera tilapiae TaxID=875043 RepID=A0ABV6BBA7_9GAMM
MFHRLKFLDRMESWIDFKIRNASIFYLIISTLVLVAISFFFSTYIYGVDPKELKRERGVLEWFYCDKKMSGTDYLYIKSSFSERRILFSAYADCDNIESIMHLNDKKIDYAVDFYVKKQTDNSSVGYPPEIYAIDYNGVKFIHPSGGLGVHTNFNTFIIVVYYLIYKLLYTIWWRFRSKVNSPPVQ